MAKEGKKAELTLNIWVSCCNFKVTVGKKIGALAVPKNSFLFLIGKKEEFLIFKDENGNRIQIHERAEKDKTIKKVF